MAVKYDPKKRDWTQKEINELFSFETGLETEDKDAVYFGELITLYNPNIERKTIENIPEHSDESPETSVDIDAMKKLIGTDSTLMANPYQIKKINPPED